MFTWTEQSLAWYARAAARSSFHRDLARACLDCLARTDRQGSGPGEHSGPGGNGGTTVAEFGCGPGFLARELALVAHVRITGLDQDAHCTAFAQAHLTPGCAGLAFEHRDVFTLPGNRQWDVVLACSFGSAEELCTHFVQHARKCVLFIVRSKQEEPLIPSQRARKRTYAEDVAAFLHQQGCLFTSVPLELEFGQPLTDRDDARAFVRHYYGSAGLDDAAVDAFLDARLVTAKEDRHGENGNGAGNGAGDGRDAGDAEETGETGAGLYLPHTKHMVLFCLPCQA